MLPYEFNFYHVHWRDQIYHANPAGCETREITWVSIANGKAYSTCYSETKIQDLIECGRWIIIDSINTIEDECISDVSTIL